MQYELVYPTEDPDAVAAQLRALVPPSESVQAAVEEIIAAVRAERDEGVLRYTRRFDTGGVDPSAIRVPEADLRAAAQQLDPAIRAGLAQAIENVRRVGEASLREDKRVG